MSLQLEIMHLGGWFDYGTVQLHGGEIAHGLVWALMFLCVGIFEEGMLRGYVQRVTTDGLSTLLGNWSFGLSALLSQSSSITSIRSPREQMRHRHGFYRRIWRTGDLWFAIGNHAAWDDGESFLFGTPNSGTRIQQALVNPALHGPALLAGGTDGPQGSGLVLCSEALIIVLVAIICRQRKFPLTTANSHAEPSKLSGT